MISIVSLGMHECNYSNEEELEKVLNQELTDNKENCHLHSDMNKG